MTEGGRIRDAARALRLAARPLPFLILLLGQALAGCYRLGAGTDDLDPSLARYAGREIRAVEFRNAEPFRSDTLRQMVDTEETRCRFLGLPVCPPFTDIGRRIGRVNLETLRRDAARLAIFYRSSGYFGTTVAPDIEEDEEDERVRVVFHIDRGDAVILESLTVEGTEGILDPDAVAARLPLRTGEIFDLGRFTASADSIQRMLLARGHAYAEVLRNYTVDPALNRAQVLLVAEPGPVVRVDSIIILGSQNLGHRAVIRQLPFRQGDLLRAAGLQEGQRNLYSLDLVQFASVSLAPDTLQVAPSDSSLATVLVTVAEGPVHVVDASAGYGTIDCFRTQARWVSRSFQGGARRLGANASVSRIGLGNPLDFGFAESICQAVEGDRFSDELDFRLGVDLTQPYFMGPRNHLTINTAWERETEPGVFQREAQTIRAAVRRRLNRPDLLTGAIEAERGRTEASEVLFCLALQVCSADDIASAQAPRWRNSLELSWTRDRTGRPMDPVSGYSLRTGGLWATPLVLSEVSFLRWTGEGAIYRLLRPGYVTAGFLRLGSFLGTGTLTPGDDFIRPEERFFAGGANTVRGFERGRLSPGVYVADSVAVDPETNDTSFVGLDFVPVGGTAVALGNAELRMPSPFLTRFIRLVLFVDAGAVGTRELWDLRLEDLRVTPGAGVRLQTPVGPIRLDMAYNPHALPRGPLFVPDAEAERLVRVRDDYREEAPPPLRRFRLHLAVGQAF
jgi:outer membrane protein insertion porin family